MKLSAAIQNSPRLAGIRFRTVELIKSGAVSVNGETTCEDIDLPSGIFVINVGKRRTDMMEIK